LTEISLLADQLDPISLTEQDVDNLTLQIETVKNTPVNGDDI
jgi:hypothetical protein